MFDGKTILRLILNYIYVSSKNGQKQGERTSRDREG